MAQNRVQYQKGLSMPEVFDRFGSVQQCEERVRAWRWPSGFVCPRCEQTGQSEFRRHDRLYFQCSSCRYQCSLVSGTIFESSKLPLPRWFLAMHLMTQAKNNVSALELKRHLGVSYPTAWLLKHKIMQVMVLREAQRQLTGRVEIDDAYLGGEVRGGKAGRGSPNKVPFVAAVQTTEDAKPVVMCLSQRPFTKESIQAFAEKSLAAPATLVSDGLGCFTAVHGTGILHEHHITSGGASSAKHPSFQAVNTALGNIKTSLSGTYHAFAFKKYGQRYLGQVQYLFNCRYRLRSILIRLARDAFQTAPRPIKTTRSAEAAC
ncbi:MULTISPECIES: IS1595 family transposase [unclassified Methylibium]|uniref:IS1595 family transposase n=1 Tax=unclassified Methylibium TaxID=2633235 RepID=UPI0003F3EB39|nr:MULTISPECIES: IS1595 family transposase [unclassified Methylibium]EWS56609.1 Transposase [Methylibium sp. T29]EWS61560.1 Transposase [Methylibium sp. T29-B]MBQ1764015.1 IS1595 family transposase [Aquincola sp.]|tara:strand:+ start:23559 stop:24512 length:954 start_codon:yes stop_codon:yes gene_type:complete